MAAQLMLSTVDNPYNPWRNYDEWNAWDKNQGYGTEAYLARVARTSEDLSDADYDDAVVTAINEITSDNLLGLYIAVLPTDLPRQATGADDSTVGSLPDDDVQG